MATAVEMASKVGKHGTLSTDRLNVAVNILDAKSAYGKVRLLVSPVSGDGQVWVEEYRVTRIGGDN